MASHAKKQISPARGGKKPVSTRERILDAAEALFADYGYEGVSIRTIMSQAGADLGSSSYYFGTKDELLRQIVVRRAPELLDEMGKDIDAVWAFSNGTPSIEDLIAAQIKTPLAKLQSPEAGWRSYIRLLSHLNTIDRDQDYLRHVHNIFDDILIRMIDDIRKQYPQASDETIFRFFHYMNGMCLLMFQGAKGIDHLSGGIVLSSDYDKLLETFPGFMGAGFHHLLQEQQKAAATLASDVPA